MNSALLLRHNLGSLLKTPMHSMGMMIFTDSAFVFPFSLTKFCKHKSKPVTTL